MVNYLYKKDNILTLVEKSQKGDVRALEELIRRVQQNIYAMFSYLTDARQDISDLTQESLIKMAKGIKNLNEPKYFKSWLNHIVTNVFYDYTKKHALDSNIDTDSDKLLEFKDKIGCEPGEKCLFSEIDKIIRTALLSIPQNLRIVIILREYEGLSYEQISKVTNTNVGTVKSRIARARLKLQSQLKEFI